MHGLNTELLYEFLSYKKRYIDNEVFEFKNIAEVKPKYYHSAIQGPASALRCEVLNCCSRGSLPSLLLNLRLANGPDPIVVAVTKLWHLCTQIPQVKSEQLKLIKTDPSTWP
jgi:hypothetical protein